MGRDLAVIWHMAALEMKEESPALRVGLSKV